MTTGICAVRASPCICSHSSRPFRGCSRSLVATTSNAACPRSAAVQHRGEPDYALTRELVGAVDVPVIVSGGLDTVAAVRRAHRESGAAAVMIARGALGNPWIFEELTGRRAASPGPAEIVDELLWTMDRAEEHLGGERANRYLRKFYPWYLERLGVRGEAADRYQRTGSLDDARELLRGHAGMPLATAA